MKTIWTNTEKGNNHSLVWHDAKLTLTVIKADGTTMPPMTAETISMPEEWADAFANLGPNWTQTGQIKDGEHFTCLRTAHVLKTGEIAIWLVDHDQVDGTYVLNDSFKITRMR